MTIRDEYEIYLPRLKEISNSHISKEQKITEYSRVMSALYTRDREKGYNEDNLNTIMRLEMFLSEFLFDINVITDFNEYEDIQRDYVIKKIVCLARQRYEKARMTKFTRKVSCKNDSLTAKCIFMSDIIIKICQEYGIRCIPFDFFNDVKEHRAVVIELGSGNSYLVDCTYQQFFILGNNLPNRHITKSLTTEKALVGHTMLVSGKHDFAKEILEKGFVKISEQGFKAYMDGFISTFYADKEKDRYLNYSNEHYYDQIITDRKIGEERQF